MPSYSKIHSIKSDSVSVNMTTNLHTGVVKQGKVVYLYLPL